MNILITLLPLVVRLAAGCMINYEYYDPVSASCKPCAHSCLTCLDSTICVTCTE